jgi:hypothetical protein
MWDWGDGTISEWVGPFGSGLTATAQHSWTEKGTYSVRVKAKDIQGDESNWSEPLSVTMPLSQTIIGSFFEALEQHFPFLFHFLQEIFSRAGI